MQSHHCAHRSISIYVPTHYNPICQEYQPQIKQIDMGVQCNTTPISTKSKSCKYLLPQKNTVDAFHCHNDRPPKRTNLTHNHSRIYKEQLLYYLNLKQICKERVFHPLKLLMRKRPSHVSFRNEIVTPIEYPYAIASNNHIAIRNKIACKLKCMQNKPTHSHIYIH